MVVYYRTTNKKLINTDNNPAYIAHPLARQYTQLAHRDISLNF